MVGTNVRYIYREPHIRWFTEWIGTGQPDKYRTEVGEHQTLYRLLAESPTSQKMVNDTDNILVTVNSFRSFD
jgi:hypothetical protein